MIVGFQLENNVALAITKWYVVAPNRRTTQMARLRLDDDDDDDDDDVGGAS